MSTYSYIQDREEGAIALTLDDGQIHIARGSGNSFVRLSELIELRLINPKAKRLVCRLSLADGSRLDIASFSHEGLVKIVDHPKEFFDFVLELHGQLKGRSGVTFKIGNISPVFYIAVLVGLVGLVATGILFRPLAAAVVVPILFVPVWVHFRRNSPRDSDYAAFGENLKRLRAEIVV